MRSKRIGEGTRRTFVLVFEPGEEAIAGLQGFAREQRITAGHFTAIGAFSGATLGFFDRAKRTYEEIPVGEQVEVLTLAGNISLKEGAPQVHAHVVVGKRDGTAHGGHLLAAHVWPTLEVILSELPEHLQRVPDEETGLALLRP
jgi:uncharacterized protein